MPEFDLTISLVLYHTDILEIENVLKIINSTTLKTKVFAVDNSSNRELEIIKENWGVEYIYSNANLGYGKAHNIAIAKAESLSKYHLVLNCDVDFDPNVLKKAFDLMEKDDCIGLVSPMIKLPNGEMQHFCRMLPTPLVLFGRRFLPSFLRPLIKKKLDNFLLMHKDYSKPMNIPNLPGCFMFMRTSLLKQIGGFDEGFFMYVEDIDLTRRLHEISKTMYYPDIVIEHSLARGSYSILKLTFYHINSAIYYFNKWGWFYDDQRVSINERLL